MTSAGLALAESLGQARASGPRRGGGGLGDPAEAELEVPVRRGRRRRGPRAACMRSITGGRAPASAARCLLLAARGWASTSAWVARAEREVSPTCPVCSGERGATASASATALAPAAAAQVEVGAARRAGRSARRPRSRHGRCGRAAREHRLGAVEALDPDRGCGRPSRAPRPGPRARLPPSRNGSATPEQLLAGAGLAEREVGLPRSRARDKQLQPGICGPRARSRARSAVPISDGHVAGAHVEHGRLEVHRGRAQRVGPARAVGLGGRGDVVGVRLERGADADVNRPPPADLGAQERVLRAVDNSASSRYAERLRAPSPSRTRVGGRLEQPPGALAVPGGELRRAARSRARPCRSRRAGGRPARRPRARPPRPPRARRRRTRGARRARRCPPRRRVASARVGAHGALRRGRGVVGGRAQQRVAEVEPAAGDPDEVLVASAGSSASAGNPSARIPREPIASSRRVLGRGGDEQRAPGRRPAARRPRRAERALDAGAGPQRRLERLAARELRRRTAGAGISSSASGLPAARGDEPLGDRRAPIAAGRAAPRASPSASGADRAAAPATASRAAAPRRRASRRASPTPSGAEPPAGEQERLQRRLVEPLRVVDRRRARAAPRRRRASRRQQRRRGR